MPSTHRLSHHEQLAATIYQLHFNGSLHFLPGQYAGVYLPSVGSRLFTISGGDSQGFRIITRYDAHAASAFKQALFALRPDGEARVSEPQGDFVLPKDAVIPLVFVALGLGITPFLAMAEWLVEKTERRSIALIRQARSSAELLCSEIFARAGIQVIDHVGRLEAETILTAADVSTRTLIYIAGPERGVRALEDALKEQGIRPYQIVTDAFLGYVEGP